MIRELQVRDAQRMREVIATAFKDDPLYVHNFKTDRERLTFVDFLVEKGFVQGETFLGYFENERLIGVASLELNIHKGGLKYLNARFLRLVWWLYSGIGGRAFAFFMRYKAFIDDVRPKGHHYYLVFIGVDPSARGKGVGGKIIEAIHRIVDADIEALGIALDTENATNIPYYERFGYRVIAERSVGGVPIFAMLRVPSKEKA
ncbi:MAG: GNAT family N-acetyltransferase [bacterium]|nr:GNAT family N-acetyltransferase [bacterium]